MFKRLLLFALTNLAVAIMLTFMVTVMGAVALGKGPAELPLPQIAGACVLWGTVGALLSLSLSRWGARRALRVRLVDGKTRDSDLDWLHSAVQRLAGKAGLAMPRVGVYDSDEVNALSTGPSRRRALVVVSTGMLHNMSRDEITGVLGHEVTHVANGDMVTMTLVQGVLNAFVLSFASFARIAARTMRRGATESAAQWADLTVRVVLQACLGILASLLVARFSRRREFRADAGAPALAGSGSVLAALRQLERTRERIDGSHPALAVFRIAGRRGWLDPLATHPPLARRILALERSTAG